MNNKVKAIKGGKWVSVATGVSVLFQFLQISIVARLLDPSSFGVVSISSLIIGFFSMFSNLGFNNSIIYKQEEDRKVLSSLYFLNIALGVLIFIIIYLLAPFVSSFYNEENLATIVRIASFFFLIVYFGQIYSILMQKELRFRTSALIDIASVVIGTISTVILAYKGFEEYSLIYGQLINQLFKTGALMIFGHDLFKPMMHFKFREVRDHLKFGIFNFADGIVGYIQSNSDNLLIGKILGVKILGYYTLALQLAVFPISRINPIILQVVYPIMAKMKNDKTGVKRAYIQILDFISYFNIPLLAGLFITADTVVPLVYGPGWEPTIHLIRIVVLAAACMCLAHPLFTLAFSNGKPNIMFYLNVCTLVVKVPLVLILGKYALADGVAWAVVLATFTNLVVNFVVVRSFIGNFFGDFFKNFGMTILFSCAMMAGVYFYKLNFGYEGLMHAIVEVGLGAAIFLALTLLFKVKFRDIKSFYKLI